MLPARSSFTRQVRRVHAGPPNCIASGTSPRRSRGCTLIDDTPRPPQYQTEFYRDGGSPRLPFRTPPCPACARIFGLPPVARSPVSPTGPQVDQFPSGEWITFRAGGACVKSIADRAQRRCLEIGTTPWAPPFQISAFAPHGAGVICRTVKQTHSLRCIPLIRTPQPSDSRIDRSGTEARNHGYRPSVTLREVRRSRPQTFLLRESCSAPRSYVDWRRRER